MNARGLKTPPGLVTALKAPRLPLGHVRRSRLNERLDRGAVSLICGPPGSGKTSLLCSWLAEPGRSSPVGWVSLDPSHDDPLLLWEAVLTALRAACGDSSISALDPPVRGSDASFMPRLVNELAALEHPATLVLDDLHVLRSRQCLDQLAFLVLHPPPTLRVMLSGRADPPLPLHVPRVLGTLTEIRARDLAFTEPEASQLLAAHGLELDPALVSVLCRRTEGWAAGLRLAALRLQGHGDPRRFVAEFGADDSFVADFLLAEVLERLPERRREFLLRTSIGEKVCGGLADAITGEADGEATLAELERVNGFVVGLDQRGEWYRYHTVFARLLEIRARRELGDEMRELHRRAARWHAAEGDVWPAIAHAVAGEDTELAARLTATHGVELVAAGHGRSLAALVARLPSGLIQQDGELAGIVAYSLIETGEIAAAGPYLEAAEALAPGSETLAIARLCLSRVCGDVREGLTVTDAMPRTSGWHSDGSRFALLTANLGRTALWAGATDRAAHQLGLAVALTRARGLDYLLLGALGHLALLELARHGPDAALPLTEEALELARRHGWMEIPEAAPVHLAAAAAAVFAHRLQSAEAHLSTARNAIAGARDVHLIATQRHLEALLAEALGLPERGLAALDPAVSATPGWGLANSQDTEVRLRIATGDMEAAAVADVAPTGLAHLRLAEDDPYGALEALDGTRPDCAHSAIELLLLKTLAHCALERSDVRTVFESVLAATETSGHRTVLLRAGERLRPLLRDAVRHGTAHRALVAELLDLLDDPERPTVVAHDIDDLTGREESLLRFLDTTLSNREIADELFISTNTVKTHLRSIYRKLDVTDRRAAAQRARALGLLHSRTTPLPPTPGGRTHVASR